MLDTNASHVCARTFCLQLEVCEDRQVKVKLLLTQPDKEPLDLTEMVYAAG